MNVRRLLRLENDRVWRAALTDELRAIHDLLPDCPTCGGSGWFIEAGGKEMTPCPDCLDMPGKVPPARLVALWEAVWDDGDDDRYYDCREVQVYLRSVKP